MQYVQSIEDIQRALRGHFPEIHVDGDIGKLTTAAVQRAGEIGLHDLVKEIQQILARHHAEIVVDGVVGPQTLGALHALDELGDVEALDAAKIPPEDAEIVASTFADPADVAAFRKCTTLGNTESFCFSRGDNGIGKWGGNCAQDERPMVALPREVWRHAGKTGGDKLLVVIGQKELVCELGDTMPSLSNIHNGALMDMNPAVCKFFGIRPPAMVKHVRWHWLA